MSNSRAIRVVAAHLVVEAVDAQRLGDDLADGQHRVERGIGVLEDVLHVPPHGLQRSTRRGRSMSPAVEARWRRRWRAQAHDGASGRGLAAAAISPTRPRVSPGRTRQADAVDRAHPADGAAQDAATGSGKCTLQVLHHQQRRAPCRRPRRGSRRSPRSRRRGATPQLLREMAGGSPGPARRRATAGSSRCRARGRGRARSAGGRRSRRRSAPGTGGWPGIGIEPRLAGVDARHAVQQRRPV